MPTSSARLQSGGTQIQSFAIGSIRKDGQTQHRSAMDPKIVAEYLMRDGFVFPPAKLWWDGADCWLADGFHRLAAAESALDYDINAEVWSGSLGDAQSDSFSANTLHGLRWTVAEREQIIQRAVAHPHGRRLSNVGLAKHLRVSEKTIRRWRKTVSSACVEAKIRLVTCQYWRYLELLLARPKGMELFLGFVPGVTVRRWRDLLSGAVLGRCNFVLAHDVSRAGLLKKASV